MSDVSAVAPETWSGVLEADSLRLRLRLDLGADGSANLLSVDQSEEPSPGQFTLSKSGAIKIDFPTIGGVYSGRIVSPDRIEGRWRQHGSNLTLVFDRGEAALAPPPGPYALTHERLAEIRVAAGSPAMAAASARREGPMLLWVDGERVFGSGIAVQGSDVWHVGSITKSMTSTLVARLADLGALHWDETVGDVLGGVAPRMRAVYRAATFRHLLSHRSGLPRDLEGGPFSWEIADAREEREAYARESLSMAPVGPMTTTFEYSNAGYVVAGTMLEVKLGESWENLITAHLFEPLGLATAGFGAPGRPRRTDQPVGHEKTAGDNKLKAYPKGVDGSDNPVVIGPAGRAHMSLQDLLSYLSAHRDRTDYLTPESWEILHTPPFGGDYAMGWVVQSNGGLWHDGSNGLWYAAALVDGGGEIVAAAVANDGYREQSEPAVAQALQEATAAVGEYMA
jgi:CubicO group peptidase (beta-lactamase class C family)